MLKECEEYMNDPEREEMTKLTQEDLQNQKAKLAVKGRPERVSYFTQVRAALIRDYQQRWGDQW